MRRAVVLSAFGLGTTSPNPPVGCVILDRDGHIVGERYHEHKGEPHAETQALAVAGERAGGGTAVVTLEPCNHHGRTPPCRAALIDAGVARVVISVIDPTSPGEGGAAALRSAGLDVEVGVLDDEVRLVIGPWLTALEQQRPFVTLVYAVYSDGRVGGLLSTARPSLRDAATDAEDLRLVHDVVLFDDGRCEEGVRDGHGQGVFDLATMQPSLETGDLLASLVAGGVRSLLVHGNCSLASTLLEVSSVDQAVAYVETGGSSSVGQTVTDAHRVAGLVPGFALRDVTRVGAVVRVSSTRVQRR
ncbi:MAG: bifunctional diaminohydroxyphosphoribosylaminopyrimidine deaminase/5-amino-6-(5-phosphoribosylamino)uracil reductase RibD [Pseudonocardiaceae bacterium]